MEALIRDTGKKMFAFLFLFIYFSEFLERDCHQLQVQTIHETIGLPAISCGRVCH